MGLTRQFLTTAGGLAITIAAHAAGLPPEAAATMGMGAAKMVAFQSPYTLGNTARPIKDATDNSTRNGTLSPTSIARMPVKRRSGGNSGAGAASDKLFPLMLASAPIPETRDTSTMISAGVGAAAGYGQTQSTFGRFFAPEQERRIIPTDAAYDPSRIKAIIDELGNRHRDHGLDTNPNQDSTMPVQTLRDVEGNILMQGHAMSIEHLIAIKLKEAESATDPTKKVVNLAGADFGDQKLEFKGFSFSNVDMRGATGLKNTVFEDCKFENVDAAGIDLRGTVIKNCHMERVNLEGFRGNEKTKFSNTTMADVCMAEADAPQVQFEHVVAKNLNIAGANMNGSRWNDVQVDGLWGVGAQLNGAKMGDVHIQGRESSLEEAQFEGAMVANTSFGNKDYGIKMAGLKAANSTWDNVQFNKSEMDGADFKGAHFKRNVDMSQVRTDKKPMDMDGANLTGLTAGDHVRMKAKTVFCGDGASKVQIDLSRDREIEFYGTNKIKEAHAEAIEKNIKHIFVDPYSGEIFDAKTGERLDEMAATAQQTPALAQQRRPVALMAPAPPAPGRKKRS